jgi:hypothetical protein
VYSSVVAIAPSAPKKNHSRGSFQSPIPGVLFPSTPEKVMSCTFFAPIKNSSKLFLFEEITPVNLFPTTPQVSIKKVIPNKPSKNDSKKHVSCHNCVPTRLF